MKRMRLTPRRFSHLQHYGGVLAFLIAMFFLVACGQGQRAPRVLFRHSDSTSIKFYTADVATKDMALLSEIPYQSEKWGLTVATIVSPDGRYIAWVTNSPHMSTSLVVVDTQSGSETLAVDGSIEKFVDYPQNGGVALQWSPNSRYIALLIVGEGGSGNQVQIYDVVDNQSYTVADDGNFHHSLAWSPSSEVLAFGTQIICDPTKEDCSDKSRPPNGLIEAVDISDFSREVLFDLSSEPSLLGLGPVFVQACHIDWSPSEKFISFQIECQEVEIVSEIFVGDISSQVLTNVTSPSGMMRTDVSNAYSSKWSPNGDKLAIGIAQGSRHTILGLTEPAPERVGYLIYDAVEKTTIWRDTSGFPSQIAWSKDGQYLVWRERRDLDRGIIRIVSALTGEFLALPVAVEDGCAPLFSPDGSYLAFYDNVPTTSHTTGCVETSNIGEVRVIVLDSQETINLTQDLGGDNKSIGWLP